MARRFPPFGPPRRRFDSPARRSPATPAQLVHSRRFDPRWSSRTGNRPVVPARHRGVPRKTFHLSAAAARCSWGMTPLAHGRGPPTLPVPEAADRLISAPAKIAPPRLLAQSFALRIHLRSIPESAWSTCLIRSHARPTDATQYHPRTGRLSTIRITGYSRSRGLRHSRRILFGCWPRAKHLFQRLPADHVQHDCRS